MAQEQKGLTQGSEFLHPNTDAQAGEVLSRFSLECVAKSSCF